MNKEKIGAMLASGMAEKCHTYEKTGIVCVKLKRISGTCGIDVDSAYISPDEIEITDSSNTHYGYGHFVNGNIVDNSSRAVFEIVARQLT